tara:strand:+ start:5646 stop:6038 length:393 start_codon:yes stop_codon:yes gene_type:complete
MWNKVNSNSEIKMLDLAISFTGNHILYGKEMENVVFKWKNTMINHLTNKSINRKAFLGHCAVFYKHQIPEYITRKAWKHLTKKQQILADNVAHKIIKKWETMYMRKLNNTLNYGKKDVIKMGYQMNLPFK